MAIDTRDGISVTIEDDGRGFDATTPRTGFGLASMRERAQIINALVHLESSPGGGTRVVIALPRVRGLRDAVGPTPADAAWPEVDARLDRLRRGVDAQEAECARLAREIHDDPVQHLASVLAHVRLSNEADDLQVDAAAERMQEGVDSALRSLANLADGLAPPTLGGARLSGALRRLAERVGRDGLEIVLDISPHVRIPADAADEISIYRIVHEALVNARTHGQASHASVALRQTARRLIVIIRDDGRGFDAAVTKRGHGLTGIAERAQLLGATLTVSSAEGAGTTVRVSVPNG